MNAPPVSLARHGLLVSVQNSSEAEVALSCMVPWIDLKNPQQGSLGQPEISTARAVSTILQRNIAYQVHSSVALGELANLDIQAAQELLRYFPIGKVGLAGLGDMGGISASGRKLLERLLEDFPPHCHIVPAIYADHQRASAPTPESVLEFAAQAGSRYLLIDTFLKDERGLFDWLTVEQLTGYLNEAHAMGSQMVIAGSLRPSDWSRLQDLPPTIFGIRGAACVENRDRSSRLSATHLAQWTAWIKGCS